MFRVRARNAAAAVGEPLESARSYRVSGEGEAASDDTQPSKPPAPKYLSAALCGADALHLQSEWPERWRDARIRTLLVEVRSSSAAHAAAWQLVGRVPPQSSQQLQLPVALDGELNVRVTAVDEAGDRSEATQASETLRVRRQPPSAAPRPLAPGKPLVQSVSSESVSLQWAEPVDMEHFGGRNALHYVLEYRGIDLRYWRRYVPRSRLLLRENAATIRGILLDGGHYMFRVYAQYGDRVLSAASVPSDAVLVAEAEAEQQRPVISKALASVSAEASRSACFELSVTARPSLERRNIRWCAHAL